MSADMQRQRLRHLVSSAVLDLWKKETGSVTSVTIEGTICITVQGGRTTVIQLSDRYTGLIPEVGCGGETSTTTDSCDEQGNNGELRANIGNSYNSSPSKNGHLVVDSYNSITNYDDRRDRHLVVEVDKDGNNNQKGVVDAEREAVATRRKRAVNKTMTSPQDANETMGAQDSEDDDAAEIEVDDNDDAICSPSSVTDHVDRAGSYHVSAHHSRSFGAKRNDDVNDSAIHDMSMSFGNETPRGGFSSKPENGSAAEDLRSPLSVSRWQFDHVPSSDAGSSSPVNGQIDGSDLSLSSPHDLTAQVRNVIRQRLMKQLSPFDAMHHGMIAAGGTAPPPSFVRPQSSPYYRPLPSPQHWSTPISNMKREAPEVPSSVNSATRRLMTLPFGSPSSNGGSQQRHPAHHHHLLSPTSSASNAPIQMGVGLPGSPSPAAAAAAIQFGASLHNLLGMRAAVAAAAAAAAAVTTNNGTNQSMDHKIHVGSATSSSPVHSSGADLSMPKSYSATEQQSSNVADGMSSGSEQQKIYQCDYCFKTFLFKSKYHEHLPVHTSARPFQCHLCTRTYKYKYDLRVHLRTHLGIPTKSTVCPFCAGRFATNKLLRQHMRNAHSDDQAVPTNVLPLAADNVDTPVNSTVDVKPDAPLASLATGLSTPSSMSESSSIEDMTSDVSRVTEQNGAEVDSGDRCVDAPVERDEVEAVGVEKLTVDVVS